MSGLVKAGGLPAPVAGLVSLPQNLRWQRRLCRVHLLFSATIQDYAQIHSGASDSCYGKAVAPVEYIPPTLACTCTPS